MIRKAALQILAFALLGCIAWNAYMAVKQLTETQRTGAVALENSKIKAEISGVLRDLTDMETGQRGYLLTADASYLQPYSEAKARIETDFCRSPNGDPGSRGCNHSRTRIAVPNPMRNRARWL